MKKFNALVLEALMEAATKAWQAEEDEVLVSSKYATVADLFGHGEWLISNGRAEEGRRTLEMAKVALERAGGDRTKRLRDVSDQHGMN